MALLHMDGCDTYSAVADAAARYAGSSTAGMGISTTAGRFGGGCISPGSQNNAQPSYLGGVTFAHSGTAAIIAGGAVFPQASLSGPLLCFYNSTAGSGTQTELYIDYFGGFFRLYRGYGSTLLATASVGHTLQMWHHVEVKAAVADAGSCEIRVNGQTIINYSGDTRHSTSGTAGIDRVYFCSPGSAPAQGAWDDFYVMDTSGSTMNDFIGDCRVHTLAPTSDAVAQFTRSTGASNYLCVDEGRQNSDTDYVESSTAGHIDKYGYGDLPAAVTTVYGAQAISWVKKTDASNRTFRTLLYSGAATATGTAIGLTTAYSPVVALTSLNPDGSVQWTPTSVNAALAGFEIVT